MSDVACHTSVAHESIIHLDTGILILQVLSFPKVVCNTNEVSATSTYWWSVTPETWNNQVRQGCPPERDVCNWIPPSGGAHHQRLPSRTRDVVRDKYAGSWDSLGHFRNMMRPIKRQQRGLVCVVSKEVARSLGEMCRLVGRSYRLNSPCKIRPKSAQPGVQRVAELRSRVGISEPTKICHTPMVSQWEILSLSIVLVPFLNSRMATYDRNMQVMPVHRSCLTVGS